MKANSAFPELFFSLTGRSFPGRIRGLGKRPSGARFFPQGHGRTEFFHLGKDHCGQHPLRPKLDGRLETHEEKQWQDFLYEYQQDRKELFFALWRGYRIQLA